MKYIELQYAFELEVNSLDNNKENVSSQDILYWLNQGVSKFIKTRYGGNNFKRTSFEQDEKRSRDLMSLYKEYSPATLTKVPKVSYDEYSVTYPEDLLFVLDEAVNICPTGNTDKVRATEIFECTLDSYMYRITNTLTDFHYHHDYARPLRVRTDAGCRLLTDGNYDIVNYTVGYLRKPTPINLTNPFDEYTELPDYTHNELVKLSAQMYIENSSSPRYETINNEISLME